MFLRAEHRTRILQQNAEQVLGLVEGMFPDSVFESRPESEACTQGTTTGEHLACLWSRANLASAGEGDHDTRETALYTVSRPECSMDDC